MRNANGSRRHRVQCSNIENDEKEIESISDDGASAVETSPDFFLFAKALRTSVVPLPFA